MKIGDMTFNLNPQALAVLQYLSSMEANFIEEDNPYPGIETHPWYNGRERGIVISLSANFFSGPVMHIAIFEHRNSDDIIALKWETKNNYFNGPVTNEETLNLAYGGVDNKYNYAKSFNYGNVGVAANWIYNAFEDFYKLNHTIKKD